MNIGAILVNMAIIVNCSESLRVHVRPRAGCSEPTQSKPYFPKRPERILPLLKTAKYPENLRCIIRSMCACVCVCVIVIFTRDSYNQRDYQVWDSFMFDTSQSAGKYGTPQARHRMTRISQEKRTPRQTWPWSWRLFRHREETCSRETRKWLRKQGLIVRGRVTVPRTELMFDNLWTYIGYFRGHFPNDWSANWGPMVGDRESSALVYWWHWTRRPASPMAARC